MDSTQKQILRSWNAPVAPRHIRGKRWYISAAVIIGLCVLYGMYWDSLPFAIVALLVGLVYILLRNHTPHDVPCVIATDGIAIGKHSLAWESTLGYWFLKTPGYTELHVVAKEKQREMTIQTGSEDLENLKTLLNQYIPELTDRRERLIDTISRICKL